jgi:hypothetical protein
MPDQHSTDAMASKGGQRHEIKYLVDVHDHNPGKVVTDFRNPHLSVAALGPHPSHVIRGVESRTKWDFIPCGPKRRVDALGVTYKAASDSEGPGLHHHAPPSRPNMGP